MLDYFGFPPSGNESFCCSTTSQTLGFVNFQDLSYSHRCVICISLMADNVEHLFICLFATCIGSLVKCLLSSFLHFLLCCLLTRLSSIYILESILYHCVFGNIFSESMICLLILLTMSFTEQNLITLIKFYSSRACHLDFLMFFHLLEFYIFFSCYFLVLLNF